MKRFNPALYRRVHPNRHPRFALRCADGCFSGSIDSRRLNTWGMAPVRDYPYEGLTGMFRGENWKLIDGLAVRCRCAGRQVKLEPWETELTPHRAAFTYRFTVSGGVRKLTLSYYVLDRLHADTPPVGGGVAAVISIHGDLSGCAVQIVPLVDIRHMYGASDPAGHRVWAGNRSVWAVKDGLWVTVRSAGAVKRVPAAGVMAPPVHSIAVRYRLGSGFRVNVGGMPVPIPDERHVVIPGAISVPPGTDVTVACSSTGAHTALLADWAAEAYRRNEASAVRNCRRVLERLKRKRLFMNRFDIAGRAAAMGTFGVQARKERYPEAGGWWFRTPWFRDVFEGVYNSREAVTAVFGDDYPARIITGVLDMLDPVTGLVPNKFEESGVRLQYSGADATLLAYMTADSCLRQRRNLPLECLTMQSIRTTVEAFEAASLEQPDGPPVLHENGLLTCPSWHSWTDGKRTITVNGVPYSLAIRIPESWERDCIRFLAGLEPGKRAAAVAAAMNRPLFFLPEINAQWILVLRGYRRLAALQGKADTATHRLTRILDRAEQNYRRVFMGKTGFLRGVVTHADFPLGRLVDETVGSPQAVAVDLLAGVLFSEAEVEEFTRYIISHCLVYENGKPFGIPVRRPGRRVYFGDNEYHEEVVWPRDIPYLIRLLLRTGRVHEAEELVRIHLERQDREGVVFYNPELYSLGDPGETSPVPVKNPMQWWSQWIL